MRLRKSHDGITLNVVAGTSAVLFSIDMLESDTSDLLGFYIRKVNLKDLQKAYDITSSKHFPDTPKTIDGKYNTKDNPWQSFLWEDFYISYEGEYEYFFTAVTGTPENLRYDRTISIKIKIPSVSDSEHEVYFNRGVAGSQAYAREFKNVKPSNMSAEKKAAALKWLSKGLKEALIGFIEQAKNEEWSLRCCFYEFIYPDVLEAIKAAHDRGVDIKVIYDSRHEAEKNDKAINKAQLDRKILIRRTSDPDYLQHNKFMMLSKNNVPQAVWLGSTNITEKAIFGHCNVGHIVRNKDIALKYLQYWDCLSTDPLNEKARNGSIAIQADLETIPDGITTFFSPRPKQGVLKLYSSLITQSNQLVCGMFPFSFSKYIKASITSETDNLKYIIIDKKDKNTSLITTDRDNVIVYGGRYENPLYDWASETFSAELFYSGVNYIHNKVILIDPLSENPIVITGSANFSENSVLHNDENTLIIKGNKDVADLYFTEFLRIFNHYSTRQDTKKMVDQNIQTNYNPSHLRTNPQEWTKSFFYQNALKYKRRKMFSNMNAIEL
ncbi:phospholipase D-like domain-containing protein [Fluviicola sp.]|uniref:phospholipase D-like domain-containing protein n=1 Tax=Fluviicola sp. TaxID=1917219 RepID=UPI003D2AD4B7